MKRVAAIALAWGLPGAAFGGVLPAPVTDADYRPVARAEAELGQLLFYDPILSGNRNISCATCHHPRFGTSDGLSLGMGEGGIGLGPDRVGDPANPPEERIPRNAPALFNLGAKEFTVLFHDGRIGADPAHKNGLRTPLEDEMTEGFASILSAQTMFPVLSQDEMAGHYGENDVSIAARQGLITGPGGAWDIISKRVAAIPAYAEAFAAVYPEIAGGRPIGFTDISNAIAAFMEFEWRADNSAFDAHLSGDVSLTGEAADGMALFYGEAGCSTCHSGPFQTDHGFHATGQPQIGPGKKARFERHHRDEGRFRVTNDPADLYAFRTPSLRNVLRTAPYGHAGAFRDLDAFIAAHAVGGAAVESYDRSEALLIGFDGAEDWWVLDNAPEWQPIAAAMPLVQHDLSTDEIDALLAFLGALTDPLSIEGRMGVPESVPSGLPVDR